MIEIYYRKENHNSIILECVHALKQGKSIAFPTDTSYGLAVDATNIKAVKKLYKIKGRDFNKPVHVVVPNLTHAKKIVEWGIRPSKLAKKFWPGPLTLVLKLKIENEKFKILSAGTGFLGVRMPRNKIALDLSKHLKRFITATSANRSGEPDCYSANNVMTQFQKSKFKPDIILNAGKLPKRKPSTLVKITSSLIPPLKKGGRWGGIEILRPGPISENNIKNTVSK